MEEAMKFNLSELKPILESDAYALYTLGQVKDNLWKGVRVNKKTQEQDEVLVEKHPVVRVVEVGHQKTR